MKIVVVKMVAVMAAVAILGVFFFDGVGGHPYRREELESQFLTRAAEVGAETAGGETLISEEYGNSVTFLLETEDGERACGTYVQSLFSQKFKEYRFYSGVNGVLALDDFGYSVNDGAMAYEIHLNFGAEPSIQPAEQALPILYLKFVGICVIAMAVFGCRIFLQRKK